VAVTTLIRYHPVYLQCRCVSHQLLQLRLAFHVISKRLTLQFAPLNPKYHAPRSLE